jgi:hypothetical protein
MISRGSNLPNDDHVMRYVPWAKLRKDEYDNVVGFLSEAFKLRDGEASLSLNWLEYFSGPRDEKIRQSVEMFRRVRGVGSKSAFGVANVKRVKEVCAASGASRVRVVYEPEEAKSGKPANPAHSGIRHLPRDDMSLLEALASEAFAELVRNSDVP